jgi:hypothetical protein
MTQGPIEPLKKGPRPISVEMGSRDAVTGPTGVGQSYENHGGVVRQHGSGAPEKPM